MREIDAKNEKEIRSLKSGYGDYGIIWVPTREQILKFAAENKDFTLQHVDLEYARNLGHPDLVAHGLLVLSKITLLRPDPTFEIAGVKTHSGTETWGKFRGWVFAGDEVHGRESITDIVYSANRRKFFITSAFQIRIRSRDNKLAMEGTYKVLYEMLD